MVFLNRFKFFRNNQLLVKFIFFYRKRILILFFLGLFSSSLALITPYLSKLFIDKAFIAKNFAKFLNLSIWGAVVFIFTMSVKAAEDIIKNKIAIKLKLDLAGRFIRKFYSLDLSFFQSRSVGESVYRLSDVENVANFILEQCPGLLVGIFKLVIILGISFWINARMTVFLLILSPLFILHSLYLQKKVNPIYKEIWRYSALVSQKIYEAFSRILIIKAFGWESYQRRIYLRSWVENIRWRIKSFRWTMVNSLSSSFLTKAIYGAITLYGGWLIIKGRMTLGSYTAVMLYLTQLGGLLGSLSNNFAYLTREAVSLNKFFEIMNTWPLIKNAPEAKTLPAIKGEILFQDVCFGYNGKPVINELNFKIPSCSWIGVVGPSGCGKTTLINLILRLYDPDAGRICLDGLDLREIKLDSLRGRIAIATQQPLLFDVSVKENISYGFKNIQEEQIIAAAKIACVHDFICQLPQGYHTFIGEDACRLSQGLKQRISIARAILRNPQLLILDEATSSVDSFTEELLFKALRQKRQGLSTIIISHRLFSIKDADRIYFLRGDGKIEEGAHDQLLAESPAYRDFFHNQ
ncbi:MAG: ABC transporter ATP-binding protein/permease [Candidatus Omnitrophica bacterium]|nr:ABC transporter ATP-binding protein/permease [Candidatus Omnitrophota bacterium]MBU4468041.1 ABC transporter ATP-binding protein/permease [Candidatus Omnitrophota bacterium]